jgi:hypothetical protein
LWARIGLPADGGRIAESKPVHLPLGGEKIPFQVTRMFPGLTRQGQGSVVGQPATGLAPSPVVAVSPQYPGPRPTSSSVAQRAVMASMRFANGLGDANSPAVDIHCHILPGIDDRPAWFQTSAEM